MTRIPGQVDLECNAPDCTREVYGRGLCNKHYQMLRKNPQKAAALGVAAGTPRRNWDHVARPAEALAAAINALPSRDCVPWTGSRVPLGYGTYRNRNAHVVVYEATVGAVPEGMQLDHLCHTHDLTCLGGNRCPHRPCVNPAHLEPVTPRENSLRSAPARRDQCGKGHEYTPDNTGHRKPNPNLPYGARYCRTCARASNARYKAQRSAA